MGLARLTARARLVDAVAADIGGDATEGAFVFRDMQFFPLTGRGYNALGQEPLRSACGNPDPQSFHFTSEVRYWFEYQGDEVLEFLGDDDVWVFVNRKLALDLGGVHGAQSKTIDFDAQASALGISTGNTYQLDVFHAERHTTQSNFRIETSIDCLVVVID